MKGLLEAALYGSMTGEHKCSVIIFLLECCYVSEKLPAGILRYAPVIDGRRHCDRTHGGVVTLSEISLILAIDQQAKSLKSHASALGLVGEFRSI